MNPHSTVMCCEAILMERDCECGLRRPDSVLQWYSNLKEWKMKGDGGCENTA